MAHGALRRAMVLADMRDGLSAAEAARRGGVSPSSALRWARLVARTGSAAPGRTGDPGRRKLAAHRDWLRAEVAARPGITLAALRAGLRDRGVEASLDTIWRMLREEGLGVGERTAGQAGARSKKGSHSSATKSGTSSAR